MSTAAQSIRTIAASQPSAVRVLERFHIDLCSYADQSLRTVCSDLQLSLDQLLENLEQAASQEIGATPPDPHTWTLERLIQHIVRTHHQSVRRDLPRLAEMARKVGERVPEMKQLAELVERLRADALSHIQKEEMILFPFIGQMEQSSRVDYPSEPMRFQQVSLPIFMMEQEHEAVNSVMSQIRQSTNNFEPPSWACPTHAALLAGLREYQADLEQHHHLENDVLFPSAIAMEAQISAGGNRG